MSCILEDFTLEQMPTVLEELIKKISLKGTVETKQRDLFLMFVITLLSENGFLLIIENAEVRNLYLVDDVQLSKWKQSTGGYELSYVMDGFNDILIKLVLCPLGTTCLINAYVSGVDSEVYSVCLSMDQYVYPEAANIRSMFYNLKDLSDTFKNKIVAPLRSAILTYCGYSSASLIGLPEELTLKIMLYLPISDISSVGKTCRKLNSLLNNDTFWHKLFKRDFRNETVTEFEDWRSVYKKVYCLHQDSKTRSPCVQGTLHHYMDLSDYTSYIDNPLWDDII